MRNRLAPRCARSRKAKGAGGGGAVDRERLQVLGQPMDRRDSREVDSRARRGRREGAGMSTPDIRLRLPPELLPRWEHWYNVHRMWELDPDDSWARLVASDPELAQVIEKLPTNEELQ